MYCTSSISVVRGRCPRGMACGEPVLLNCVMIQYTVRVLNLTNAAMVVISYNIAYVYANMSWAGMKSEKNRCEQLDSL
jgi:hypothetical protein